MTSLEIDINLGLSEKELVQIELHSFHNLLTIIFGELQYLGNLLGESSALQESLRQCDSFLETITELVQNRTGALNWPEQKKIILADISKEVSERTIKPEREDLVGRSVANIRRILDVVDVRVKELMGRLDEPGHWEPFSNIEVTNRLKQVLDAMVQNSRGRYGIVYDPDMKGERDYLIRIDVQGLSDGIIHLPPVLLDTLRDLTANARKYTAPGGRVESILKENHAGLTLTVSDTGRGIPEDEIERVVHFGKRGSNTTTSETKGGGYGLTKAAYVCRKHGGRMWIASGLGEGTTVTLKIPKKRFEIHGDN